MKRARKKTSTLENWSTFTCATREGLEPTKNVKFVWLKSNKLRWFQTRRTPKNKPSDDDDDDERRFIFSSPNESKVWKSFEEMDKKKIVGPPEREMIEIQLRGLCLDLVPRVGQVAAAAATFWSKTWPNRIKFCVVDKRAQASALCVSVISRRRSASGHRSRVFWLAKLNDRRNEFLTSWEKLQFLWSDFEGVISEAKNEQRFNRWRFWDDGGATPSNVNLWQGCESLRFFVFITEVSWLSFCRCA